jgi:hypothetical protein
MIHDVFGCSEGNTLAHACLLFFLFSVLFIYLFIIIFFMKVTLEAEVTNKGALALYGRLGFIRAKRLFRYYLNGVDAFRLKLLFPCPELYPPMPMMANKEDSHQHNDHIPSEECSELHQHL